MSSQIDDTTMVFGIDSADSEIYGSREADERKIVTAGIWTADLAKFSWTRQFKNTSKDDQISQLTRLQKDIGELEKAQFIHITAENTQEGAFEEGTRILNKLLEKPFSELSSRKNYIHYKLDKKPKKMHVDRFTTLCGYTSTICYILQKASENGLKNIMTNFGFEKIFLALDTVPYDDERSLNMWETLKYIYLNIYPDYGIGFPLFGIGPITPESKYTPLMNLADWFAAIYFATNLEKSSDFTIACNDFVHRQEI